MKFQPTDPGFHEIVNPYLGVPDYGVFASGGDLEYRIMEYWALGGAAQSTGLWSVRAAGRHLIFLLRLRRGGTSERISMS